jgi:hypothetical protein
MSNPDNNKPNPAMGTGPGKSGKENADMDRDTTADTEMDDDLAKGEVNPGEPAPAGNLTGKEKGNNEGK